MTKEQIQDVVQKQREYFNEGKTLDVKTRKYYLKRLKEEIKAHETEISEAIEKDLGKSAFESYMCETGFALSEISFLLKNINKFTKKQRVKTPLAQFASKSYMYPSPYGTVLIMSPWNYPFLLAIEPLAEAIAAGNTVVLKPSAYSPSTLNAVINLLAKVFPPELVSVISGGREENSALLDIKFDYIFFTGSKTVGSLVYKSAAKYLTPVTLELGGKSPCIVDSSAKIELAARRIVFGKFLNCGQTCVAPDYVLCKSDIKQRLITAIKREIIKQFGAEPLISPDYGKIISKKHFDRVSALIGDKTVHGGKTDESLLKIEPTVLDNVTWEDPVMGEEIFGPVLPVLTFESIDEVIQTVNSHDAPLALYIFSTNKKQIERVMSECGFGGGCINDVIIHLATSYMPFGGFKESGLGAYHGKKGFETFTHYKSIVDKKNIIDLPMRYRPYKKSNEKLIRFFLK